ncbi:BEN domain-containing protein 4-like [Bacillus rossius redtenbacheri]|uniref:BEN domain-containing protein 4-like n=1 Tax=Bacillus rossius redtenbacheri TaxID=93214 RepID=UPI002FDE24D2
MANQDNQGFRKTLTETTTISGGQMLVTQEERCESFSANTTACGAPVAGPCFPAPPPPPPACLPQAMEWEPLCFVPYPHQPQPPQQQGWCHFACFPQQPQLQPQPPPALPPPPPPPPFQLKLHHDQATSTTDLAPAGGGDDEDTLRLCCEALEVKFTVCDDDSDRYDSDCSSDSGASEEAQGK